MFMSSDENSPQVSVLEAHEELIQHIENGTGKIKTLSVITVFVAAVLAFSYALQLVLPLTGTTTQPVNLADPTLMGVEAGILVLTLLWLYVGLRDYLFVARLSGQIREIRAAEAQLLKKYGLEG
jgi:hypothetical protein